MSRSAATLLVAALFAGCGAQSLSAAEPVAVPPAGPAPRIVFDAKDVNLGDVVHGQDAVATFTYHNTGSAPLHILSAKPG
jgi:hypothetical protein